MAASDSFAPPSRRGRAVFWVLLGTCALAWLASLATAVATTQGFTESSTSMENTIRPGDHLLIDRTALLRRGDVVVEQQRVVGVENYYLRRVIGLPGDHVACCDAHGRVTVNGRPLHETYLYPGDAPSAIRFHVTVPAGKLFMLGDHRRVSADSRLRGPVAVHVVGRVFLIVGFGRVSMLRTPRAFVADGLAPPDSRIPRAVVAAGVSAVALAGIVVLVIVGVVRYAIRRGRRGTSETAGVPVPLTAGPPSDGGNDGS